MDIENLIEQYRQAADKWEKRHPVTDTFDLRVQDVLRDAATALSTLQEENEKLRADLENYRKGHCSEGGCAAEKDRDTVMAELEQVKRCIEIVENQRDQMKRERDAAKSPEVLEAVDELMEFARTRMSIGDWLYYVNVLGEWRGPQKED